MSRFRFYLKPFNEDGTYQSDFIEITQDVQKLGNIGQQLDNTTYGVGIFRNSSFSFTLLNSEGLYSEADTLRSIFKYKKADSIIKVTWDQKDFDNICGFTNPQMLLTDEVEIYRGLLSDVSARSDIDDQTIQFTCLGFESLFDREVVPIADISNGDTVSSVIFECLDQTIITEQLTVDVSNINVDLDTTIDDISSLETKTVKEALEELLLLSNSILKVENLTVYVRSRDADASLSKTFYGQAAINGVEDIIDLKNLRDGYNRLFNYWNWEETTIIARDTSSVNKYGVKKNTIKSDLIAPSSTSKIESILGASRDEFSFPKTELELVTPMTYDNLELVLSNRVKIDYPTIYVPADNNPLPRYGLNTSLYGQSVYPYGIWPATITTTDSFKIIGKKLDTSKETITFLLRKI